MLADESLLSSEAAEVSETSVVWSLLEVITLEVLLATVTDDKVDSLLLDVLLNVSVVFDVVVVVFVVVFVDLDRAIYIL